MTGRLPFSKNDRVIALIRAGQLSKAKLTLVSTDEFCLPSEEDFENLTKLFMVEAEKEGDGDTDVQSDEEVNTTVTAERPVLHRMTRQESQESPVLEEDLVEGSQNDAFVFSVDEIIEMVDTSPRLSAGGRDGIRFEWLRDMIHMSPSFASTLANALTAIGSGSVPNSVRPYLFGAKITTLRKKNKNLRPICPGEVLVRLLGRLLSRKHMLKFSQVLQPHQMGLGIKDSCHMLVMAVKLLLDADDESETVCVKMDFKNAYGSVKREAIRASLEKHDQVKFLLPWFDAMYGAPTFTWR